MGDAPVLIFPKSGAILPALFGGEVREWLNRHDWKSCVPQGTEGSNPSLSATRIFSPPGIIVVRRGAGVVERGGLENR